jgi:hypothetical protein
MGDQLRAKLRLGSTVREGSALLEHDAVYFRGEARLKVPLRDVVEATSAGGKLVLVFSEGRAELDFGANQEKQAAKWVAKIKNPKSVIEKLGVKAEQAVSVLGIDDPEFLQGLERAGAKVTVGRAAPGSEVIFFGVSTSGELSRTATLARKLDLEGAFWIVRPKGTTAVTELDVFAAGKAAGLVDVKVVRFSELKTAHKFVVPVAKRRR